MNSNRTCPHPSFSLRIRSSPHEFLEDQPLEAESLVAFFSKRQAVMLRSESEHSRFAELTKSLTFEERWELNRSRRRHTAHDHRRADERPRDDGKNGYGSSKNSDRPVGHFWGKIKKMFRITGRLRLPLIHRRGDGRTGVDRTTKEDGGRRRRRKRSRFGPAFFPSRCRRCG